MYEAHSFLRLRGTALFVVFQSDGRLILTQLVTLLFLSLSKFFCSHHRALSEKEMKSVSTEKIASGKASSDFKQRFDSKFDCYFLLHEINGLHLLHYGYDFYVNSTRYCGWKASSSLLPRSTHDLSYISKLYPFRVFGLLQFPDGPPQTKG